MYDFETAMVEWGASPKKKKAAPKKAAPVKAKKAPKPAKRAPAPKRVAAPKKAKAPKKPKAPKKAKAPQKAKPPKKTKAVKRAPPPKKARPAPKPKAPKKAPKAARKAPPPKRAASATPARPSPARTIARRVLAASGSASLALVPTSLRSPEPEPDFGPEPEEMAPEEEIPSDEEMPSEEEMGPGDEESPEDDSDDYSDEPDESEEDPEEDESEESEEDDMELGTLQTTEAVEMQPAAAAARLADSIRTTTAPILRRKGPLSLSAEDIKRRASQAIAPACSCSGRKPEDVRRKLNQRFMRRGYPPGTSDKLLAGVHVANEIASDIADHRARQSGPAMQKLVNMVQTLPNEHPTKLRVIRLLLTAKVLP
jgi:hypothetical protein